MLKTKAYRNWNVSFWRERASAVAIGRASQLGASLSLLLVVALKEDARQKCKHQKDNKPDQAEHDTPLSGRVVRNKKGPAV